MEDILKDFIKQEEKFGKTYINFSTQQEVDEIAFRTIAYSTPKFIPAISFTNIDESKSFSYDITEILENHITLTKFIEKNKDLSPLKFVTFMQNFIDSILQSHDYFLEPANLILNEDYIYVNEATADIYMIYVPFKNKKIFEERELNLSVFTIAKNLIGRPSDIAWQQVILKIWDITDKTTLYDAKKIYAEIYSELPKEEAKKIDRNEVALALDIIEEVSVTKAKRLKKEKKKKEKSDKPSIFSLTIFEKKKKPKKVKEVKEENIFSENSLTQLEDGDKNFNRI